MPRFVKLILFLITILWLAGIFSEWLTRINGDILYAVPILRYTYSLVCHQIKDRLISRGGFETMVCARCTGIYTGAAFSSAILLFLNFKKRPEIKYLFISAIPLVLDVFLHTLGVYHYSKSIAFMTGLLLGSVGFLYLYEALNRLFIDIKNGIK